MKAEDVKKNETNFLFISNNDNAKDERHGYPFNRMAISIVDFFSFSFYKWIWKIEVKFVDNVFLEPSLNS